MELTRLESLGEFNTMGASMLRGDDNTLIVRFYKRPVPNPIKSKQAGRPMYDALDYVYIQHPGERDNTDRPAHDGDKMRFARQWAQYERNAEQVPEGTPLTALFVDPNLVNVPPYLNGIGIYTVEQLADLSATGIQNIGLGGQEWNNLARKYLDASNKGREFHRLDRENKELKNVQEVQQQQIEALKAQINQMMAERYNQAGVPNRRPQAHASIAQQQFMVPDSPPLVPEQAPPADDYQPIPVYRDPDAPRRGRPPGSKNRPTTTE